MSKEFTWRGTLVEAGTDQACLPLPVPTQLSSAEVEERVHSVELSVRREAAALHAERERLLNGSAEIEVLRRRKDTLGARRRQLEASLERRRQRAAELEKSLSEQQAGAIIPCKTSERKLAKTARSGPTGSSAKEGTTNIWQARVAALNDEYKQQAERVRSLRSREQQLDADFRSQLHADEGLLAGLCAVARELEATVSNLELGGRSFTNNIASAPADIGNPSSLHGSPDSQLEQDDKPRLSRSSNVDAASRPFRGGGEGQALPRPSLSNSLAAHLHLPLSQSAHGSCRAPVASFSPAVMPDSMRTKSPSESVCSSVRGPCTHPEASTNVLPAPLTHADDHMVPLELPVPPQATTTQGQGTLPRRPSSRGPALSAYSFMPCRRPGTAPATQSSGAFSRTGPAMDAGNAGAGMSVVDLQPAAQLPRPRTPPPQMGSHRCPITRRGESSVAVSSAAPVAVEVVSENKQEQRTHGFGSTRTLPTPPVGMHADQLGGLSRTQSWTAAGMLPPDALHQTGASSSTPPRRVPPQEKARPPSNSHTPARSATPPRSNRAPFPFSQQQLPAQACVGGGLTPLEQGAGVVRLTQPVGVHRRACGNTVAAPVDRAAAAYRSLTPPPGAGFTPDIPHNCLGAGVTASQRSFATPPRQRQALPPPPSLAGQCFV